MKKKKHDRYAEESRNLVNTLTGKIIEKDIKLTRSHFNLFNRAYGLNNSPLRWMIEQK